MKTVPEVNLEDGECTAEIWRVQFTTELNALEKLIHRDLMSQAQYRVAVARAVKLRIILFGPL